MVTVSQVSQLQAVPEHITEELRAELHRTSIPWRDAYQEYQSGGWSTAPLLNSSGSVEQTRLDGKPAKPTPLYEAMPVMKSFVESLGLRVLLARLAKIGPGGWMYEHHDDVGLKRETIRFRLHVPIETNRQASLSIGSEQSNANIFLKPHCIWKLDHEHAPHSASNLGEQPRIHLILDCFCSQKLTELIRAEHLDSDAVIRLPVLEQYREEAFVGYARSLYRDGQERGLESVKQEAEHQLLRLFHMFDLQGRSSYEILLQMFNGLEGTEERLRYWQKRLREVRGPARLHSIS